MMTKLEKLQAHAARAEKFVVNRPKPRVVVCAANQFKLFDGRVFVVCAPRHYDVNMIKHIHRLDIQGFVEEETQGFVDQFGVFMTRKQAWRVAEEAGQIKYRCGGDDGRLFSENLY